MRPPRRRAAIRDGRRLSADHRSGIANPYPPGVNRTGRSRRNSAKPKGYLKENQAFRKVLGCNPGHALSTDCDDRNREKVTAGTSACTKVDKPAQPEICAPVPRGGEQ